jgi:hypothetical protein
MITPPPKKNKLNPMLMKVLLISVGVHVLALVLLGSYIVVRSVIPDEAQFEEPPVVVAEVPPPEVKIEIKPQNQPMQNNLKMRPVANIAVAKVSVNLPSMDQSFTVSTGLGNFGGGSLLGGTSGSLGIGLSDVSVFGLKTRAERILFVIDANRHMVTDKKGGLNSYKIIKDEITDMVGNLSAGTLFNVMLQDRSNTMLFKPQLSSAGAEVHQQLIQWINPINATATNVGLEDNRAAKKPTLATLKNEEVHKVLPHGWGGNETGFITQYALEQNVDAIFFITGYHRGFETLRRPLNEREEAEWQRKIAKRDYVEQLAEHNAEIPEMEAKIRAEMVKINADRKKKGQPPRVLEQRWGVYSNARELGIKWTTSHPGHRPSHEIKDSDVAKYFRKLVDELYEKEGKPVPSVSVVLFLAGDEELREEWKNQLDEYVRFFRGKNRVIRGEDEIKSASSAKDITN